MSYDPTNWKAGDVISSQKLNKLEQGVADAGGGGGGGGAGILVLHDTDGVLDKTFKEISDAFNAGVLPVVFYDGHLWYLDSIPDAENFYFGVKAINLTEHVVGDTKQYYIYSRDYVAASENSYPEYDA